MHLVYKKMLSALLIESLNKIKKVIACEIVAVKTDVQHRLVVDVMKLEILQHQCCLTNTAGTTDRDKTTIPINLLYNTSHTIRFSSGYQTATSIN